MNPKQPGLARTAMANNQNQNPMERDGAFSGAGEEDWGSSPPSINIDFAPNGTGTWARSAISRDQTVSFNKSTISRDQTAASHYEEEQLIALKPAQREGADNATEVLDTSNYDLPFQKQRGTPLSHAEMAQQQIIEAQQRQQRSMQMVNLTAQQERSMQMAKMAQQQSLVQKQLQDRKENSSSVGSSTALRFPSAVPPPGQARHNQLGTTRPGTPSMPASSYGQSGQTHHTKSSIYIQQPSPSIHESMSMRPNEDSSSEPIGREHRYTEHVNHWTEAPALTTEYENQFELLQRIRILEEENRALQGRPQNQARTPKWQVFHCIEQDNHDGVTVDTKPRLLSYLAEPSWDIIPNRPPRLQGHLPITDPESYAFQNGVDFAIYKVYLEGHRTAAFNKAVRENETLPAPEPVNETLGLLSEEMRAAVEAFFTLHEDFKDLFPGLSVYGPFQAPFLWWYHYRTGHALETLEASQRSLMLGMTYWIDEKYGIEYGQVESQLERGVISRGTMSYLIRPGDVLISGARNILKASLALNWPQFRSSEQMFTHEGRRGLWWGSSKGAWELSAWSYGYDGIFFREEEKIKLDDTFEGIGDEVPINSLKVYPLRFANEDVQKQLETRGRVTWSCRHKKLVGYKDDGEEGPHSRFMVDYATYKRLHPESISREHYSNDRYMSQAVMEKDEPPPAPELYVFPRKTTGYNLRAKKWVDLEVDLIQEVTWNKKAFRNLVVDEETKELVQALVMNQLEAERGTDLIHNKGNGLIMLLHGGPGTGKTLTAESVAEMAQKPLYPVTCGDIGTKPEEVEKYLQSVLHLGKTWNCVVLLDEAEVFLEQRTLSDLTRNALVSVFLRVLEYYDGILILTSNRVGTFDEAFKSRIQLSLHYEKLGKEQRQQVWRNFFSHLKSVDERNIDFDDIECYISELAEHPINGREIRNSITTARKLAQFKGKKMTYAHLKHAIKVASKFDKYLEDIREGITDEQLARDDGVR